ncbi:MAG: polysaccharide deacetylase family protein [Magnetococcales bacterium]|nr:polysaccharide deacetylase family protein [Magnetococcales bacterium]NGZ05511.1 polysaccharide deacetylase family protein [Magnetococcales bacterium]
MSRFWCRLLFWLVFGWVLWPLSGVDAATGGGGRYDTSQFTPRFLYPGGEVVLHVDWLTRPEERVMALTFDDGPELQDLEILSLLEKHGGLPATFFYLGAKVKAMPEIVKKVHARHHDIGYHSFRHQRLRWFSQSGLSDDFRQGRDVLSSLGVSLKLFRPPYGDFSDAMVRQAKEQGMETVLWTIDSRDWTGIGADAMARNVIRHFHPGAVLLFHSQHAVTLRALPMILEAAEREGYRFVSLKDWRKVVLAANCRMKGEGGCVTGVAVAARVPVKPEVKKEGSPAVKAAAVQSKPARSVKASVPVQESDEKESESGDSEGEEEEPAANAEERETGETGETGEEPVVSQVIDPVIPSLLPITIVSD